MNLHAVFQSGSEIRVGAKEKSHSAKNGAARNKTKCAGDDALNANERENSEIKPSPGRNFAAAVALFSLSVHTATRVWRSLPARATGIGGHGLFMTARILGGVGGGIHGGRKTSMRWFDVLKEDFSHLILCPFPLPSCFLVQSSQNSRQNSLPPH